jgi:hypothetical protein
VSTPWTSHARARPYSDGAGVPRARLTPRGAVKSGSAEIATSDGTAELIARRLAAIIRVARQCGGTSQRGPALGTGTATSGFFAPDTSSEPGQQGAETKTVVKSMISPFESHYPQGRGPSAPRPSSRADETSVARGLCRTRGLSSRPDDRRVTRLGEKQGSVRVGPANIEMAVRRLAVSSGNHTPPRRIARKL